MEEVQFPDWKKEWERMEEISEERSRNHCLLTKEDMKREGEAYRREKQKMKR